MQKFKISVRESLHLIRDIYLFLDPEYIRKSSKGKRGIFSRVFPRTHFLFFGLLQKSNPNEYFDAIKFSSKFPTDTLSYRFPLIKYLLHSSGRHPQLAVDSKYLSQYPDVQSFRRSPLIHFFHFGKKEGRSLNLMDIENFSRENRLWCDPRSIVKLVKPIQFIIDSCKSVNYSKTLDDSVEYKEEDLFIIEKSHNHNQDFTPLTNPVTIDVSGDDIVVLFRTHTDLMLEARHINLFLNSIFQGFGAEEVKVVECIDTYLEKMSFSSQDAYYVGVNQTFSSRSFEYQNQSKLPLSIRAKNLHIKNAKRILLISHDDSLSGAPLFALQIYRQMVSQGFRVQLLVLKRASSYSASSPFSDSMLDLVYLEDVFSKNEVLISTHSTKDQLAIMCNAIFGSFKPDIVMANTVVSAEWAVKAAAAGIPSVLLVHETWGFKVGGLLGYSPEEIAIRESFESANLVVFGSSAARERWQDSQLSPNSLVLPSHRVINPTNRMKSFEKIELRHTLGIPEHAFVYLSVGSFEERKRTLDAIQSFVAFSSDSDFLVLVGDWSLNDSYCSTVRKQAAKFTNIKIIETTPDLERYYFTADCFILMSASEVYPLVLQEAAAYGLPRIISKFDGFRECVQSVNSALFYETGDLEKLTELMQLIRDSSEMREVIIRESQSEVQNNEAEASQYIDRLFNRLATPHVTSVRIAIND